MLEYAESNIILLNNIVHTGIPVHMADVKEYNTTCLANSEILWARSDSDKQRYISLQARLQANLQNPQYMLQRARKWGELTGTRAYFKVRNAEIREKY